MAPLGVTLVVREAVADDLDALLGLLDQLREGASRDIPWDDADAERAAIVWKEILADGRRAVLVAELSGRVVGTADLVVVPNLTRGARPVAFVENVVVTAERRGEGVGRALMDNVERRARAAGCYKIQLLSNADRTRAHAFYRSMDYRTSAEGFRKYLI